MGTTSKKTAGEAPLFGCSWTTGLGWDFPDGTSNPPLTGHAPQQGALLALMVKGWVRAKQLPGLFLSSQILKQRKGSQPTTCNVPTCAGSSPGAGGGWCWASSLQQGGAGL